MPILATISISISISMTSSMPMPGDAGGRPTPSTAAPRQGSPAATAHPRCRLGWQGLIVVILVSAVTLVNAVILGSDAGPEGKL